ncbi:MAG: hypothetical protein IPK32_21230 [Verrucomicrobiaceae bacterium]|nr:hypothetical protein [Verrucomicrobiaceae bacterium]
MKIPGETLQEDDASGEAWFRKGVTLLDGRKREREFEEVLKKRMEHPALYEPGFWIGMAMVVLAAWASTLSNDLWHRIFYALLPLTQICSAMEEASKKRMKAMMEWIEYQKTKETPGS